MVSKQVADSPNGCVPRRGSLKSAVHTAREDMGEGGVQQAPGAKTVSSEASRNPRPGNGSITITTTKCPPY